MRRWCFLCHHEMRMTVICALNFRDLFHFQHFLRLAQAGFFYTGLGVTVKCFCCRKNYSDCRTNDGILFRTGNFMHETDCDFMLGTDTSNVPMHESRNQEKLGCSYMITESVS
ncbi:hypothetical protein DPMN_055670 [Dreissena polymorpha]|uniref:Uncharacterized protein n=1 Tax=Dreissena polymorpha TaxID=45954 RepID=A0A9D4CR69_DREPO|nr:hypothetical protein DPMN_055670 [Dreissena polymorpha]